MSVADQTPYNLAAPNGVTTVFPYTFQVLDPNDVGVYIDGSLKSLGVDYNVDGVGNQNGGNLTFFAPPVGTRATFARQMGKHRGTDYQQVGDFLSAVVNPDFDRAILITQELAVADERSIRAPIYEQGTNMLLPPIATRKSTVLGFDAAGAISTLASIPSGTLSKDSIGGFIFDTSLGELAAGVTPSNFGYQEGDVRRYGGLVGALDNSAAFNAALSVSSHAGSAAIIPAGTWAITSPIVCPPGSSVQGHGRASIIHAANGCDGLQFTASDSGITAQPRFVRDFQILGTLSGTTNAAHGIYINAGAIDHTAFSGIAIFNFQYGMYCQGLYYCTIEKCWIQNCYQGILFNNQSVNVWLLNNTIQLTSSGTLITAAGNSSAVSCQGAPEIEALHVQGGSVYGYNYGFLFGLIFECQIEAVDISFCTKCPIKFASTIGGMVIRDCWVELSGSGTWNDGGTGTGNLTGIFVSAITPTVNAKVNIHGNYIISDGTIAGSTGVYIGNGNAGLSMADNHIIGFDVGIGGGNSLVNSGSASTGLVVRNNTINIVRDTTTTGVYSAASSVFNLNSLGTDMALGPNYIVPGTGAAASVAGTATITVPNQATAGNQQFPVGTPVRCTTTLANGPDNRVTYYVVSSATTAVQVSNVPGGAAIAWTGTGSIGSLLQTPDPVTFTAGTPAGTTFIGRGAFHIILSDPAVSGVCLWQASGKVNSLYPVAALTGAAGSTSMTATGLPAYLAPNTTQNAICGIENNSVGSYGLFQVTSAAGIVIATNPLAVAFTNAGTKGLLNTAINYSYG